MDYTFDDMRAAYRKLGVSEGRTVLLSTDLALLGMAETRTKTETLQNHLCVLQELLGDQGTIVVPTFSYKLCNTDTVFDSKLTPCETGVLPEYIRQQQKAVRSFHPFSSFTALGYRAEEICSDVTRHAYGPHTPPARLIELDALAVSIGRHARLTCSIVHHIEFCMGVPYRYTKEFMHPVVKNGQVAFEPFYVYVWYRQCDLKRNRNQKLFDRYSAGFELRQTEVGRGTIYSYPLKKFYASCTQLYKEDIYAWLEKPPTTRPYQS